jgi:hypothetical protein
MDEARYGAFEEERRSFREEREGYCGMKTNRSEEHALITARNEGASTRDKVVLIPRRDRKNPKKTGRIARQVQRYGSATEKLVTKLA